MRPRISYPKPKFPDLVIYTDVAAKTRIIAALILNREEFMPTSKADVVIAAPTGVEWEGSFSRQHRIYGLELLAIIAIISHPSFTKE